MLHLNVKRNKNIGSSEYISTDEMMKQLLTTEG